MIQENSNSQSPQRSSYTHRGLNLSYLDSAPDDRGRPVVLLLHGFPDEASMWSAQITALHGAGFRVLAPDLCGYGESDIAPKLREYHARRIVADQTALLDHLGVATADVVGHDWGAVIAWFMAIWAADRVRRLVVMSVGHPTVYARAGWEQKRKGWYTLYFQLPWLSERMLASASRFSLQWVFGSHPRILEAMKRVRRPGRMLAAIRLYRANALTILFGRLGSVTAPTLGLYSEGDAFLSEAQMQESADFVSGGWRYEKLPGGHWIPLTQTERCNQLLVDFLSQA